MSPRVPCGPDGSSLSPSHGGLRFDDDDDDQEGGDDIALSPSQQVHSTLSTRHRQPPVSIDFQYEF